MDARVGFPESLALVDGVAHYRPRGPCTLLEAVALVDRAIAHCRDRGVAKLMINTEGLEGVPVPSLVDRFLMVEEWAHTADGMVAVVMVVPPEYVHTERFGVKVAIDHGVMMDVYTSERNALAWLASGDPPNVDPEWLRTDHTR